MSPGPDNRRRSHCMASLPVDFLVTPDEKLSVVQAAFLPRNSKLRERTDTIVFSEMTREDCIKSVVMRHYRRLRESGNRFIDPGHGSISSPLVVYFIISNGIP